MTSFCGMRRFFVYSGGGGAGGVILSIHMVFVCSLFNLEISRANVCERYGVKLPVLLPVLVLQWFSLGGEAKGPRARCMVCVTMCAAIFYFQILNVFKSIHIQSAALFLDLNFNVLARQL